MRKTMKKIFGPNQISESHAMDLTNIIRNVPDFPKSGIVFRDITPLLADAQGLALACNAMAEPFRKEDIDLVVGRQNKIVICGPSGSGKSTLIRTINRLEEHQKGKIIALQDSLFRHTKLTREEPGDYSVVIALSLRKHLLATLYFVSKRWG